MNRLSATIIACNEEKNLARALASLACADEILVVDSGSTDRTREIALRHGARVLERAWTNFGEQKNFAAAQAAHDWILSLDADEELSPELQAELRAWKERAPEADAYEMPRKARYLGAWIHHSGWYPDVKIRLYRRDRARWVGALHESVEANGRRSRFAGEIFHHTCETLGEHMAKVNFFTRLAAGQLHAAGRRRWLLPALLGPPWTFLRTYVFQQGFRDGVRGWLIACFAAYYVFLKYARLGLLLRGIPDSAPESSPR